MIELTRGNHFMFGYDGKPFAFRHFTSQKWWVHYGRASRKVGSWREECLLAAQEIRERTPKDIWICLSGGIDSEVVAESFRLAKIPVRAAILQFEDGLNSHDIEWAVRYCERVGLPYEVFPLDILKFWRGGEMIEIARETHCVTPQFPSTMKLMEFIHKKGGYPVLGSGECYLERVNDTWVMMEREKVASLYRFLLSRQIEAQAGFFQWNPEVILSFLLDPMVQSLIRNGLAGFKSTYHVKPLIYRRHFQFENRPKFTGFENIMDDDTKYRGLLSRGLPKCDGEVHTPVDDLISMLSSIEVSKFEEIDFSKYHFHPVVRLPESYKVLDMSTGKPGPRKFGSYTIGRYDENRSDVYTSPNFTTKDGRRTLHLGVDIGAPVDTPVHAFYEGEIIEARKVEAEADYGHFLATRHILSGQVIYAIYGHLSAKSLVHRRVGQRVHAGDVIGWVGPRSENGGWAPHLHFQLSLVDPREQQIVGVTLPSLREEALAIHPDPRIVLGSIY